ncbi:HELP domain protein [Ancylostoma caninum]|uniref:HELP domain protein n=1 Tax=Ancylostoma caninum TaxID=29170 RepID=A0A368GXC5_ANCCA|nr:HELP domain protein [Ancylostoma caninum]
MQQSRTDLQFVVTRAAAAGCRTLSDRASANLSGKFRSDFKSAGTRLITASTGYRGKDVRNNVHYLPTGELLYFCGSIVVLHNVEEHTQRHYTGHTCDIRSVCVHPNRVLVASGQSSRHQRERHPDLELRDPYVSALDLEEDLEHSLTEAHIRIWDSVTLATLKILSGSKAMFEKAVSCLAFSVTDGGNLLACVDDSYQHTLSVWKWANEAKVAEAKGANDQVFSIGWHPSVRNLLVICGKGHFSFWVLDLKRETLMKNSAIFEVVSHPTSYRGRDKPKTVLSMCFSDTGDVITGDSNGTLSLWDPTTYKTKKQAHGVHPGGVFALCISRKGTLLSAGKDRTIAEWETTDLVRRRRPVELPDDAGTPRVISNPDGNQILVGTSRNTLFSGDFETNFDEIVDVSCSCQTKPKTRDGITCASADAAGSLLALGFCAGTWSVMDLSTRDTVFEQKESTQPITAIQFSPNGALLFVATKELSALVYRFDTPQRFCRIARIGTLSSFAISPDWDVSSQYIRANSTVGHIYHWSATSGELVDHATVRDAEWETCNCRISFEAGCVAHSVEGTP